MTADHVPTDGRLDYCVCGESWPCPFERTIIMPADIEIGDLVVDLGFTVAKVHKAPNGGQYVFDGERALYLYDGYEIAVNRTWEGRDEYIEYYSKKEK